MVVPGRQNAAPSDTQKAVESLFETQSIVEIREVETRTKTDIEEKQRQLRLLVGNSYRDLIGSADTILAMHQTCEGVLGNIRALQAGFGGLADGAAGVGGREGRQESSKRKTLHALGSRIKYLVDTPEVIWGCLDSRAHLQAARRLLRASEVHSQLHAHAPAELRAKFPLVRRLWPTIQKFRAQIQEHLRARLGQAEPLTAEDGATALAAAASLGDLTSAQALESFLDSRVRVLRRLLERALESGGGKEHATQALGEGVRLLQETVWQVGRLFVGHEGSGTPALLPQLLAEDGVAGELLFGALTDAPSEGAAGAAEADSWQAASAAISARAQPLEQAAAGAAVSAFLARAAEVVGDCGRRLLAAACASAAALAGAEASLRAAIAQWKQSSDAGGAGELSLLPPPSPTRRSGGPAATAASLLPGGGEALPAGWDATCAWLLGRRLGLWEMVLEPSFLEVSKGILRASLAALQEAFTGSLQAALQAAAEATPAPPGAYRAAAWPDGGPAAVPLQPPRPRFEETGAVERDAGGEAAAAAAGWRGQVAAIQAASDAGLRATLADALLLLGEGKAREPQLRRAYSGRSFPLPPAAPRGRAPALEPFLQAAVADAAAALAGVLSDRLAGLPSLAPGAEGAAAAEQAVLIGRLALAAGGGETLLPAALEGADAWQEAAAAGGGEARARARPQAARGRFPALQQQFREVAAEAHAAWAAWAAAALAAEFGAALAGDAALTSAQPLRAWEETVVSQEGEGGEAAEEARFLLPALPSPGAMLLLLSAGRELQRAGGAAPGSRALALLRQQLGAAALAALRGGLEEGALAGGLTERGVLQLLFDARFLQHVLAGPPAAGRAAPGPPAGWAELEAALQERLDPIDWAIYGAYLWQNVAAFQQRVRVLFGAMLPPGRADAEVLNKAAPSGEANVLSLAPPAPRFAYLPISAPPAGAAAARHLLTTGLEDDADGSDYSFANLGGTRAGAAAAGREVAAAGGGALEALQSRFSGQRLGALGSLLGDRAAEAAAMAQASFSDIGLPSAFASALGGSGGGAGSLIASFRGLRGAAE